MARLGRVLAEGEVCIEGAVRTKHIREGAFGIFGGLCWLGSRALVRIVEGHGDR